jgi:hypothetical protein
MFPSMLVIRMKMPAGDAGDRARYATRRCAMTAGAIALILILSWRGECWAYIDPNAGGFLWQIVAPLASVFLSFLFYCRKEIKRLARSVRDRWKGVDTADPAPEVRKTK